MTATWCQPLSTLHPAAAAGRRGGRRQRHAQACGQAFSQAAGETPQAICRAARACRQHQLPLPAWIIAWHAHQRQPHQPVRKSTQWSNRWPLPSRLALMWTLMEPRVEKSSKSRWWEPWQAGRKCGGGEDKRRCDDGRREQGNTAVCVKGSSNKRRQRQGTGRVRMAGRAVTGDGQAPTTQLPEPRQGAGSRKRRHHPKRRCGAQPFHCGAVFAPRRRGGTHPPCTRPCTFQSGWHRPGRRWGTASLQGRGRQQRGGSGWTAGAGRDHSRPSGPLMPAGTTAGPAGHIVHTTGYRGVPAAEAMLPGRRG